MVELRSVTKDNFEDVLGLRVADHQKTYVSTTVYALAQAYVYGENAFPFAVYADNTIVGFIMLGYYEIRNQYTLWKLLIDEKHQRKGYGKDALQQGIAYLAEKFDAKEIYTGVALGNEAAKCLYSSVGFELTGLVEDNMEEMKYTIR